MPLMRTSSSARVIPVLFCFLVSFLPAGKITDTKAGFKNADRNKAPGSVQLSVPYDENSLTAMQARSQFLAMKFKL